LQNESTETPMRMTICHVFINSPFVLCRARTQIRYLSCTIAPGFCSGQPGSLLCRSIAPSEDWARAGRKTCTTQCESDWFESAQRQFFCKFGLKSARIAIFIDMSTEYRKGRRDRGLVILLALAAAVLFIHLVTGGGYGFHRDELATLDDARH